MKTSRLLHNALLALFLTIIVLFTAIIATPHLLGNEHIRSQAKHILSKWSGGDFRIHGDIKVDYFLGAKFSAKNVEISGFDPDSPVEHITAKHLSVDISWLSLLSGKIGFNRISLDTPEVIFSKKFTPITSGHEGGLSGKHLAELMSRAVVNRIVVRNGRMKFRVDGAQQVFSNISGKVYVSSRSRIISGRSSFKYRDIIHNINFRTKKRNRRAGVLRTYLKYSLNNEFGSIGFKGDLFLGKSVNISGKQNIYIKSIRDVAKWAGKALPQGTSLQDFQLDAYIASKDNKVTLSNSNLSLDGNYASGVVTISLNDKNIDVGGTLDIPRLTLTPYFSDQQTSSADNDIQQLPFYLLKLITADLRISAGEVTAPRFQAWNSAAAISVHSGKMLLDIADMKVFEGSARGQIEIDSNQVVPKISVTGHFQDISTSHCLENIGNKGVMEGRASAYVSLTANGKTWNTILESLTGNWTVKMAAGGQVNMDLTNLFAQPAPQPVKGWNNFKTGVTRFNNLDISSDMQDGTAKINTVMLAADKRRYSGRGSIHISDHSLNYQVIMSTHNPADGTDITGSVNKVAVQVKGHWDAPEIAINRKH